MLCGLHAVISTLHHGMGWSFVDSLSDCHASSPTGTLDYMAPEVLRCPLKRHPTDNKDRTDLHYGSAVDTWAVGVLAYELLTGRCVLCLIGRGLNTVQADTQFR